MSHNHNKIILQLMIKNESKIIERCIGRALEHVDAVCILDTGSTDNTVEVCEKYLKSCGKPFKLAVEPFKNFGYNRTISFQKAKELCYELGWHPDNTYTMAVDADMIIKPSAEFKKFKLVANGYIIIQKNSSLKYYNTRFMKCGFNWKCVGVTHEYWDGGPTEKITEDIIYIDDVNDGGCKSDKFERDVRLLTEDLIVDPNNVRSHFYLAQSYKDSGKIDKAIEHYKKRIELGGWFEEVWYSHYQIAKCYETLNNIEEMEAWANKAFKRHSRRAEPLYFLTRYFRIHGEHYKAYHYYLKGKNIPYPKDDVLFIEDAVYDGLFDYENTILACYVYGKTHQDGLHDIIHYINTRNHFMDNVWSNIQYYVEPLTNKIYEGESIGYSFPTIDEFHPSSSSIIPYKDNEYLMNVRYVNYTIDSKGGYHSKSSDGIVRTRNGLTVLNNKFEPIKEIQMINEDNGIVYPCHIQGLEDVRIFSYNNKTYFTASNMDRNEATKFRIVVGEYDSNDYKLSNILTLTPPSNSNCEKNWLFIPNQTLKIPAAENKMNFIYKWHPLEVGAINDNNTLEVHTTFNTPRIFSQFRGSSNLCEFNGRLWCVVHIVKYSSPRIYYHSLVGFNSQTMKPEVYSLPFCFKNVAIEYCLGLAINDNNATFIFSQNDNNPSRITLPIKKLRLITL
jgi:tetratricopeptide (TPR) repeat protein